MFIISLMTNAHNQRYMNNNNYNNSFFIPNVTNPCKLQSKVQITVYEIWPTILHAD